MAARLAGVAAIGEELAQERVSHGHLPQDLRCTVAILGPGAVQLEPDRQRGTALSEQARRASRTKSSVRVRVVHIFGARTNDMPGLLRQPAPTSGTP